MRVCDFEEELTFKTICFGTCLAMMRGQSQQHHQFDSDFREKFVDIFINKVGKAQETDPTHF